MSVSFFPRIVASEFAPVFRLLDNYAAQATPRATRVSQSFRSFQPRFDVKESKDSYELQGEFPGFDQKDINIEFTDANTLSIKGRSERRHEEGSGPAAVAQGESEPEQTKVAESEDSSSSYHKASVEEEGYETVAMSGANPDATEAETPAESVAETQTQVAAPEPEAKTPSPRYWVSERSVGQFSRTFTFPNRVDQENVKASLKQGILSIVIPKVAPQNRRINVE